MLKRKLLDKLGSGGQDEQGLDESSSSSSSEADAGTSDEEVAPPQPEAVHAAAKARGQKRKVLALGSRGINHRQRHLLLDIQGLLPHSKKDVKFDSKSDLSQLNELCELNDCDYCLYFESRKADDLYLWMSKTASGPSIKFQVLNVHTLDELNMTGNCIKGNRPLLSFDKSFESEPQWIVTKEFLSKIFGCPSAQKRVKPYYDHVFSFSIADGKVWFRNYQIVEKVESKREAELSLLEIGPRFVLDPIRIFEGSFRGATLYANPNYVSPNAVRAMAKAEKGNKYVQRVKATQIGKERKREAVLGEDPLKEIFQ